MDRHETAPASPDGRQHLILILVSLGIFDMALGALIFLFGPGVVGDASLDVFIQIVGAVFAAGGVVFLWLARWRKAAHGPTTDA